MKFKILISYFLFLSGAKIFAQDGSALVPPKRAHHALMYDETSKKILMTGGSTPLNGGSSFQFYNDLWSFDGVKWTQKGNAGDERSGIGLAYDTKRKKMYSFGGFTSDNRCRSELRVLENNDWVTISEIPGLKAAEPGLVYDSHRDRLITFGGSSARGQVNNETWKWNGSEWKKFVGPGPEGRQAFAMVYDEKRKKTVLYGGMGTSPQQSFNDTWEFDGVSWKKVSEASPPGPRKSPGFTYDSKRGIMLIFGGVVSGDFVSDTWAWDGKEWKKLADTGPAKRVMGYMAYDKERDKVILFGGRLGWPNDANDTWEWDGNSWKEI